MKKVILLSGKIGNGKNKFAEYLVDELKSRGLSVTCDLFAKSLKDSCKEDFKGLAKVLQNIAEEIKATANILFEAEHKTNPSVNAILRSIETICYKLKIKDTNWYEKKTDITRTILQLYGTEIFRKRVDNDWWAKQTLNRVLETNSDYVILTDCRFPNEITVFTERMLIYGDIEVIAVRINRKNINTTKGISISSHDSEIALDSWEEWNYIVDNCGTLEDLKDSSKLMTYDIIHPEFKDEIALIRMGVL